MDELYSGHAEDQRKREELATRIERAHAAVLPGALREAFSGEPARANGFALEPVTLGLAANLGRIKSPLLDVVRIMRDRLRDTRVPGDGLAGSADIEGSDTSIPDRLKLANEEIAALKFDEEQIAETVFVFTRPQRRVRKLLDSGREKFRETAMDELGDKLHPTQMAVLQRACAQHYVASFATIIGYGTPPVENGEAVFPPPSPGDATGSVGGSIS